MPEKKFSHKITQTYILIPVRCIDDLTFFIRHHCNKTAIVRRLPGSPFLMTYDPASKSLGYITSTISDIWAVFRFFRNWFLHSACLIRCLVLQKQLVKIVRRAITAVTVVEKFKGGWKAFVMYKLWPLFKFWISPCLYCSKKQCCTDPRIGLVPFY